MSTLARTTRLERDPKRRKRQGTKPGTPQLARHDETPHSKERSILRFSEKRPGMVLIMPPGWRYECGARRKSLAQLAMLKRKGLRPKSTPSPAPEAGT